MEKEAGIIPARYRTFHLYNHLLQQYKEATKKHLQASFILKNKPFPKLVVKLYHYSRKNFHLFLDS
jgi:hypothetical protein